MIAQVYPIRRMPRRFGVFDYQIPAGVNTNIGDLVYITIRGFKTTGIVAKINQTAEVPNAKPISGIAIKNLITSADITRLESIATSIGQSVPSLLFFIFPSSPSRAQSRDLSTRSRWENPTNPQTSISKHAADRIKSLLPTIKTTKSLTIQSSPETAWTLFSILAKNAPNQTLILLPTGRDVDNLAKSLSFPNALAIHGKTSKPHRQTIQKAWRTGTCTTLIATKVGALLPAHNLSFVIIECASDEAHKNTKRNPRFDARTAAKLLTKQHNATLLQTDPLPYQASVFDNHPTLTIIDLKAEEQQSPFPLLSSSLIDAITDALQTPKSVLLSFNRKGTSRRFQCGTCKQILRCKTCQSILKNQDNAPFCTLCKLPQKASSCPNCRSMDWKQKGIGNARLKSIIQKAFPKASIKIIDKQHPGNPDADINIATEYFFNQIWKPFFPQTFNLIAHISIDQELSMADQDATQRMARTLYRSHYIAKQQNATHIVQTWIPEIVTPTLNAESFIKSQTDLANDYHLPPAFDEITITPKTHQVPPDFIGALPPQAETEQQDNKITIRTHPLQTPSITPLLKTLPDACIIETTLTTYETQRPHPPKQNP